MVRLFGTEVETAKVHGPVTCRLGFFPRPRLRSKSAKDHGPVSCRFCFVLRPRLKSKLAKGHGPVTCRFGFFPCCPGGGSGANKNFWKQIFCVAGYLRRLSYELVRGSTQDRILALPKFFFSIEKSYRRPETGVTCRWSARLSATITGQHWAVSGLLPGKPPSKGVSKGLDQHTYHIPVPL